MLLLFVIVIFGDQECFTNGLGIGRVAVSSLWLVAIPTTIMVWAWLETAIPALKLLNTGMGMALLPILYIGGFFGLLLQYGLVTHLHRASVYALRRWGCAARVTARSGCGSSSPISGCRT